LEVDFTIELGTHSASLANLSQWRSRPGRLARWQRAEGRSRRRNRHADWLSRPRVL